MMLVLLFFVCFSTISGTKHWTEQSIVDLTYEFDKNTIYWPKQTAFELKEIFRGSRGNYWFETNRLSAPEHGGTHLDAPAHFHRDNWHVGDIPVENLIGRAIVIDISDRAVTHPDAQVVEQDIINWEKKYGLIPARAIVFMYSGWGKKWPNKNAYYGSSTYNDTTTLHFPGFHPGAAKWLVKNRDIVGLGMDTASVDYGQSQDFQTHRILSSANVYGLENVANLDLLPPVGATVFAMPMKIKSGSGAPCRIIAILEHSLSELDDGETDHVEL